jgi:hypothetical protein
MAFNLDSLSKYTDENSFELISKAVLTTDLLSVIDLRSGLKAGTVAINLMEGSVNIADLACGWNPSGDVTLSQVDIVIRDKQIKMDLCPQDLRDYWASQSLKASAHLEDVPAEEVIADYYVKQIKKGNEAFLMNGDGVAEGIKDQITVANGANLQLGATASAWTISNCVEQALNIFDAIAEEVKDRDDLIMVVSPAAFATLRRALVAQNYFHYNQGDAKTLDLPGANIKVVKSSGLIGSDYVFAGPAAFIVGGTGLEDDFSTIQFFYDKGQDVVKFLAKWRLGVAVHQVNLFATNDLDGEVVIPEESI